MLGLIFIKIALLIGLGGWLGVACWHNILDRDTNRYLLGNMFSMQAIKDAEVLGKGLLHRALLPKWSHKVLWGVVAIQAIIVFLFILTLIVYLGVGLNLLHVNSMLPQLLGNLSIMSFISLWFFFLIGGLWFGYWIHMGQVQLTHFALLIIGILTAIIFNL